MIMRRILTAIALLAFAIGSVLYRNDGAFDLADFGVNLILGSMGFLFLHHRWKRKEARVVTPQKARDIFS
ncbi:hypothetical protein [Erythrobacter sp. F6033]|uniref:hypothetical protein n=1 Tax=Erythrobacter sp. F6033 TaxID=2926401 RepID=UPI001FF6F822|nr:hypothetical protein [Erythrobacter sp. F6033]MCK0128122.1 hypothetical protein [Erythrobacter sp. F6033]